MIPADEAFDGTWPFAPHFSTTAGFRQYYVDEGPRDGEVVVCLHGEPTWGYRGHSISECKEVRPTHLGRKLKW